MSAKRANDLEAKLQNREGRRTSFVASMSNSEPEIMEEEKSADTGDTTVTKKSKIIRMVEKKTRKKTILLQPSIHDQAAELCNQINVSMNEVINQLLINWINEERE